MGLKQLCRVGFFLHPLGERENSLAATFLCPVSLIET